MIEFHLDLCDSDFAGFRGVFRFDCEGRVSQFAVGRVHVLVVDLEEHFGLQ